MSLQVTTLEQLKKVKTTEILEVGAFDDGTMLVAEVRRPDLFKLITSGQMPNTLMKPAMQVFNGRGNEVMKKVDNNDLSALKDLGGLLDIITKECLVNPSLEEIQSVGLNLDMEQKMSILMYTQGGIKMLENFRLQQSNPESAEPVNEVQAEAKPDSSN